MMASGISLRYQSRCLLPHAGGINRFGIDAELIDDVAIDVPDASARDCAHREFLLTGNPKLSHDEDINWQSQFLSNLICDGYASSRQCEEDCVGLVEILRELG